MATAGVSKDAKHATTFKLSTSSSDKYCREVWSKESRHRNLSRKPSKPDGLNEFNVYEKEKKIIIIMIVY